MLHSNIIGAIEMGDSESHTWTLELSNHMSKSYIKYSSCTLLPCETTVSSFLLEPSKHEIGPAGSLTYQRSLINFIFNCLLSLHLVAPNGSHAGTILLPLYLSTIKEGILDVLEGREQVLPRVISASHLQELCPQ